MRLPGVSITLGLLATILSMPVAVADPGELDLSFSEDGMVRTLEIVDTYFTESGEDVAIQTDGKIIVVGTAVGSDDGWYFAAVRYLPNGELDTSFGRGGAVVTGFSGYGFAHAVAIQPDGKIIVAGEGWCGFTACFGLVRYETDGRLDTTFGLEGKVTTRVVSCGCTAYDVALHADGKIVAVGTSFGGSDAQDDDHFGIAQYTPDGRLDIGFSEDGLQRLDFGYGDDFGYAVAVQSDGKVIVGGEGTRDLYDTGGDFAIVRFNPDGTPDSTFGHNGWLTTNFASDRYDRVESLALQEDGKIVAAGQTARDYFGQQDRRVALARYNADGTLDATFSRDGKIAATIQDRPTWGRAVVVHQGGTVVVGGGIGDGPGGWDFALLRFKPDGELDTTFSDDGMVVSDFGTGQDFITSLAVQADQKIVAGGSVYTTFAAARYLAE